MQIQKRGVRSRKLSDEMQARLLHPDTLQRWAPYSLKERTMLCHTQFGFRISYYSLRNLYVRNAIKYKATQWLYRVAIRNAPGLDEKRKEFAHILSRVIE